MASASAYGWPTRQPLLQSKAVIVSPSKRPDADIDYTFVHTFPRSARRD